MSTHRQLTAATYLKSIGDSTKLRPCVILTPVPWIANFLAGKNPSEEWKSNKSQIHRDIRFGKRCFDVIQCLPGVSMSLVTMEEAIAVGVKEFYFIGTAASVEGAIPFGEVRMNDRVVSVLNPFREHEEWNTIRHACLVDMEVGYLRKLAKIRRVKFQYALFVSDAIWKNRWKHPKNGSLQYRKRIARSILEIKAWLSADDEAITGKG
jgi:hypothetical protein